MAHAQKRWKIAHSLRINSEITGCQLIKNFSRHYIETFIQAYLVQKFTAVKKMSGWHCLKNIVRCFNVRCLDASCDLGINDATCGCPYFSSCTCTYSCWSTVKFISILGGLYAVQLCPACNRKPVINRIRL